MDATYNGSFFAHGENPLSNCFGGENTWFMEIYVLILMIPDCRLMDSTLSNA